jgi:hypothetical protein
MSYVKSAAGKQGKNNPFAGITRQKFPAAGEPESIC